MIELFVKINAQGVIQNIYLNQGTKIGVHIHSIFSVYGSDFETKLKNVVFEDNKFDELSFIHENQVYYATLYGASNHVYIYVIDQKPNVITLELIHHLLEMKADEIVISAKKTHTETGGFFENMQKLNNELINKGRQIEKMNQQLNRLNIILSDRLVSDPLTALVSRYQYRDEMMLAIHKFPTNFGVFCFIDLDDFKKINDTYGHHTGDLYLVEFANRLKHLPFDNCIKMRIAGDEFGLFIYGLKVVNQEVINEIWETFITSIIKPIEIDGYSMPLSLSMGLALYPQDTDDIHLLIDYADEAMYIAKNDGKNRYALFKSKN